MILPCGKKTLTAFAAFAAIWVPVGAETLHVATPGTSLVLEATEGAPLKFVYYGERLGAADVDAMMASAPRTLDAYPVFGLGALRETAMSVTHPDGNMTLDMSVSGVSESDGADGSHTVTVSMSDKHYPFGIDVNYRTYPDADVVETWVEAVNKGKGTVLLREFASAYLPIRRSDVHLTSFYGAWGNECRMEEKRLPHGMVVINNRDGVRNSHTSHAEVMFSLDGQPDERNGRTIGAALCYSGNYNLRIDTGSSDFHDFFAGINDTHSAYNLKKGERFATPPLALTYSNEGKSGVSRNFHRWGRNHRLAHGTDLRKILLNSWEGVYFDINEQGMAQMMADIAGMGGELFVMDDGWFGAKYPRNNDVSSLGDWTVDTRKLPAGIAGLCAQAEKNGIRFGIWIEPEMVNSVSELYDTHPEYIVKPTNRPLRQGRGGTQLVLDMSNPKVQDLVFEVVDTLLTKYPQLDYIKWDANAPIMNHGSQYLSADEQSHFAVEYHRGFAKTLDRIRAKYPDVTIQACASGGGRANWGVLPWFDEFWVSDNTDAQQRVFMQWGTSHFFPSVAMASHISAAPNHQTHRTIPLKYRIDVAMSGRLGMEIQPKNMTDEEIAMCRKAIAEYKQVRPVVQQGDLYRLLSPYDGKGVASLMYVSPAKDEAVYYWWRLNNDVNPQLPRVTMAGLDPDALYTVHELNSIDKEPLPYEGKSFTGRYLMSNGLEFPERHNVEHSTLNDYCSYVLQLKKK